MINTPTLPHIGVCVCVCVPCLLIDLRYIPTYLVYLTIPLLPELRLWVVLSSANLCIYSGCSSSSWIEPLLHNGLGPPLGNPEELLLSLGS